MRLQLYKFSKKKAFISADDNIPTVYLLWNRPKKKLYPSSLYLQIQAGKKELRSPTILTETPSPSVDVTKTNKIVSNIKKIQDGSRYIINSLVVKIRSGFVLKFNKNGEYLCCTNVDVVLNIIVVYSLKMERIHSFSGTKIYWK